MISKDDVILLLTEMGDNNKEDIIKIKDELPTLEIENTTLIIGKKGGS